VATKHGGFSVFAGVGERTRRGQRLWIEFQESGVIDLKDFQKSKATLIYGQMTEPPGARLRVALTGLTVAEHFRDYEGADTLLFIDNIFRFTQAGSEVSTLLGRMPSAVGYQPNLATEMGELQERITSTKKGSVTSVQAVYVPPTTSPIRPRRRPSPTWTRPPYSRVLCRSWDLPGGPIRWPRPRAFCRRASSARSTTTLPGREEDTAALQGPAGHHRDPGHRRALRRGQDDGGARTQGAALPLAALPRSRVFTASRRVRQGRRHGAQLQGDHRRQARCHPEQAFYLKAASRSAGRRGEMKQTA